jgi:DNA-binding transcriptional MerR regulator
MLIHELAQRTGISAKTIRYYESVGLLPPPQRARNQYRLYTEHDAVLLRFIVGARSLQRFAKRLTPNLPEAQQE